MMNKCWRMIRKQRLLLLTAVLLLPALNVWGAQPYNVETFSGTGVPGYADTADSEAQFRFPQFVAQEADGTLYVSDTNNHRIRRIASDGTVTTLAGTTDQKDEYGDPVGGFEDGPANEARFNEPKGLAVAADGTVYVADAENDAVRAVSSDNVRTVAEGLASPTDVVIGKEGMLYVSDTLNHRVVRIAPEDGTISLLAGGGYSEDADGWLIGGYQDGNGAKAQFNEPAGLALDESGVLYVADKGNHRIRQISLEDGTVRTVAGSGDAQKEGTPYLEGGYADGAALEAKFNFPAGLALNSENELLVADQYNHKIRKVTADGQVRTVAGSDEHGDRNGAESQARFDGPSDVGVTSDGGMVIVDQWNHQIRRAQPHPVPESAMQDRDLKVVLEQRKLSFDVAPRIVEGRTMLPVRQIAEALQYDVSWNQETKTVQLTKGERDVRLTIGKRMLEGTVERSMEVAPFVDNGRTMVPVRFVAEAFETSVFWMPEHRIVLLRP